VNARRLAIRAARPLGLLLNRVNFRIGKAPLDGELYHRVLAASQPGDIILTRTKWRPSNLFIPGKWSHAMMFVHDDILVEATMPVVRTCWLVDVWASASEVLVVRPRFLDAKERLRAAGYAASRVGTPYDLGFSPGPRELYCSELVYWAMRKTSIETPNLLSSEFGAVSIRPDALALPEHFEEIVS
jgi:hypothetical protein